MSAASRSVIPSAFFLFLVSEQIFFSNKCEASVKILHCVYSAGTRLHSFRLWPFPCLISYLLYQSMGIDGVPVSILIQLHIFIWKIPVTTNTIVVWELSFVTVLVLSFGSLGNSQIWGLKDFPFYALSFFSPVS